MKTVALGIIVFVMAGVFSLAPPAEAAHLATNCNTIQNRRGTDQRVCIHVNRHDLWYWREGLLDMCAGSNGAKAIFLDYLKLERGRRTVAVERKHQWVSICGSGKDDFDTNWDKACRPGGFTWQAHARFKLRWRRGGHATGWKTVHSARDRGFCA